MKFWKTSLDYNVKTYIMLFVCLLFCSVSRNNPDKTVLIVGLLQTSCIKLEGSVDRDFMAIIIFLSPDIAQGIYYHLSKLWSFVSRDSEIVPQYFSNYTICFLSLMFYLYSILFLLPSVICTNNDRSLLEAIQFVRFLSHNAIGWVILLLINSILCGWESVRRLVANKLQQQHSNLFIFSLNRLLISA